MGHQTGERSMSVLISWICGLWDTCRFSDDIAYHWSFFMSKLRSAAQDSPFAEDINFAGYTVPRTSGSYEGGMLQRMLAQVGGGALHD